MNSFPTYEQTLERIIAVCAPWSHEEYVRWRKKLEDDWKTNDALIVYHRARFDTLDAADLDMVTYWVLILAVENEDRYAQRQIVKTCPEDTLNSELVLPAYVNALIQLGDDDNLRDLVRNNKYKIENALNAVKGDERREWLWDEYEDALTRLRA